MWGEGGGNISGREVHIGVISKVVKDSVGWLQTSRVIGGAGTLMVNEG